MTEEERETAQNYQLPSSAVVDDKTLRDAFTSVLELSASLDPDERLIMYDACDEGEISIPLAYGVRKRLDPRRNTKPKKPDEQRLVFGMEEPSADRVIMLPDVTGTVITTGNLPDLMEGMTLIGDTVFEGVVKFLNDDVRFGAPDSKINLAIHLPPHHIDSLWEILDIIPCS